MAEWYYARAGQQMGPVPADELDRLYRQGQITDSDLVWTAGMANWAPAREVRDRFQTAAPLAAESPGRLGADHPVAYSGAAAGYSDYGGFWLRFVALIIDSLILGVVGALVGGCFGGVIGVLFNAAGAFDPANPSGNEFAFAAIQLVINLVGTVISVLYFAFFESSQWQATLGKKALGLKVTDLDGRRISFARALGRNLARILSGLICAIGYIMAAFTERKQALHDLIAGTLVVRQ